MQGRLCKPSALTLGGNEKHKLPREGDPVVPGGGRDAHSPRAQASPAILASQGEWRRSSSKASISGNSGTALLGHQAGSSLGL